MIRESGRTVAGLRDRFIFYYTRRIAGDMLGAIRECLAACRIRPNTRRVSFLRKTHAATRSEQPHVIFTHRPEFGTRYA